MAVTRIPTLVLLATLIARVGAGEAAVPDPAKTYSQEEAFRIGWPQLAGPYGNFLPLRCDLRLIDDISKTAIVWKSECKDLGYGRGSTGSFNSADEWSSEKIAKVGAPPGTWAGVIVAEGLVFGSSFRPYGPGSTVQGVQVRMDAEDFVVAMDAETGKTRWLSAEPGGLLVGGSKRGGHQVTPAYHDGRVFSVGSTGRLIAYDARTGKKLWQSDIGEAHADRARRREAVLAKLAAGTFASERDPGMQSSLAVIGGRLIVPDMNGGLRGHDVATGDLVWKAPGVISKLATPSPWRHAGREHVLCGNLAGELRLIDPSDGKELWKVEGLGQMYPTLAPSETHVIVNSRAGSGKQKDGTRVPGLLGCWRLSPTGATKVWMMPDEPRFHIYSWADSAAMMHTTIRDGRAYIATGMNPEKTRCFSIVDVETGKLLGERTIAAGNPDGPHIQQLWYLIGDRIICRSDHSHGGQSQPWLMWRVGDDHSIALMPGELDLKFVCGYEVMQEYPIIAGRWFERNRAGEVVCYDLRAK